jgi:hypothetical protein
MKLGKYHINKVQIDKDIVYLHMTNFDYAYENEKWFIRYKRVMEKYLNKKGVTNYILEVTKDVPVCD